MTVAEFLAWPGDGTGRKFQLVDGELRAMSPGSATHGTIQSNLSRLIGNLLVASNSASNSGCRIVTEPGVITRSDLIWRQSTNNGATWVPSDLLAWNGSSSAGRQNDTASIVWRTSKRPYVLFNSWTEDTQAYRIYLTAGT